MTEHGTNLDFMLGTMNVALDGDISKVGCDVVVDYEDADEAAAIIEDNGGTVTDRNSHEAGETIYFHP